MTQSRTFAVRSNSSQDIIVPELVPWRMTEPVPKFPNKDAYREWCKHPLTNYCFFSMVEGEVSTLRVGNGNKPFRVHGVVADYDCAGLSADEVAKGIARIPATLPPRAWNRTFSGGVRVVWVFEAPVFYYSPEVWKKFINRCVKELKLKSVLPGLDEHIEMAELYYCAGAGWTVNEQATIRSTLVEIWMFDACKTDKFEGGIEVPLHVVEAEVHKRFPGRWTGDFVDGARGVRFWDETGDAKSAIVRPTGMVAFTGNEPFMPWEKIFGREFVQKYIEDRRGKALSEMYSDGDAYYRQLPNRQWQPMNTETTRRHLRVQYGLSDKTLKGDNASEIDTVLNHLEQRRVVEGALPFPLNPQEVITWNGRTFLNNSLCRLMPPHPEPQEWGVNFPWVARYLSGLFLDERNLQVFLAWFAIWVQSANRGSPCRGQSLFLVGPPGTGKTLLSRQIMARIVGGYADARDHLVDGAKFNSSLFEKALWCIDDSTVLADRKAHSRFSSLIKAAVANDSMQYEKKFGYGGAVPFCGRVVVTLNDDPISLAILPDTDQSLLDKIILLRTDDQPVDWGDLHTEPERYAMLDRELPAFVRWLTDFTPYAVVERDDRFGMKAWHDADVLDEAREATPTASVMEIVNQWRKDKSIQSGSKSIELTPTELYMKLTEANSPYSSLMRGISLISMSRHLHNAIANDCPWMKHVRRGKARERIFVIECL